MIEHSRGKFSLYANLFSSSLTKTMQKLRATDIISNCCAAERCWNWIFASGGIKVSITSNWYFFTLIYFAIVVAFDPSIIDRFEVVDVVRYQVVGCNEIEEVFHIKYSTYLVYLLFESKCRVYCLMHFLHIDGFCSNRAKTNYIF